MAFNTGFDNALSVAVPYYTKKFTDNVTSNSPFLAAMKELGGILTTGGGEKIVMPIRVGTGTVQTVSNSLGMTVNGVDDTLSAATYEWCELFAALNISFKELNQLKNNTATLDRYVQTKVKGIISDIGVKINTDIFGTAQAADSTHIGALITAVNVAATHYGLDQTVAKWTSYYDAKSPGEVLTTANLVYAMGAIQAAHGKMPNLIVTTPLLWGKLAELAQASQFVTTSSSKVETYGIGFQKFYFWGAMVVADALCPTGAMYLLNTEHIKVAIPNEIEVEEVKIQQPCRFWRYSHFAQLVMDSRKAHGQITGLLDVAAG